MDSCISTFYSALSHHIQVCSERVYSLEFQGAYIQVLPSKIA